MRSSLFLSLPIFLAAPVFAASITAAGVSATNLSGEYIEARTADVYTGPCFANSEVGLTGELAVMGWKIEKGQFQGVSLDGLSVMGVVRASNTLGDVTASEYPVKAVLIVDSRATSEQRDALKNFAQRMGGKLLADVVRVDSQTIDFTMTGSSIHSGQLCMKAGSEASLETRALNEGDQICHNEISWYPPLTKLDHAMPAYTVAHTFSGKELGTTWSSPNKRSAFVGTFSLAD
jgi:hypothetical protein